jgi:glycosyltransferase involved in cell wall biosynthesis
MTDRIPVSVVVMTKNEERNLPHCLATLGRFAEVFVVDSASADATRSIALEWGAEVVSFAWNGRYPKKKQWCLEHLPFANEWVLYVDADERLTPDLVDEIAGLLAQDQTSCAGYFATLDYVFLGRVLRHGHQVRKLVLFDRRRGRFVDYPDLDALNMWEVEGHYQPALSGPGGTLRGRIVHHDHDSLYDWFERHNRYSDWEAVMRGRNALPHPDESLPRGRAALKRAFARMPLKGVVAFGHSYVLRLGFLDGIPGLQYALARGFYYWQIELKSRELRAATHSTAPGTRSVQA